MWAKVFDKIGAENLIYCSSFLSRQEHQIVPGQMGWDYLPDQAYDDDVQQTRAMVQNAIVYAVHHPRWGGVAPSVAFLKEGPYAVPLRSPLAATSATPLAGASPSATDDSALRTRR
jgi:hypothetical protein